MNHLRSLAFWLAYWTLSVLYVLLAVVTMALPGRKATIWVVGRYVRSMVWALRWLAGIRLEVRGRENIPSAPFIIASKHHSWNDGFCMMSQFDDLAIVVGDHMATYPLIPQVFDKIGAIMVSNGGGQEARKTLAERAAKANADGRCILIYPEGFLVRPGQRRRYRSGVWHMAGNLGMPVVPVATNLGVFAPETDFLKRPGTAVIEFLPPMQPGSDKAAFMANLEAVVETRSNELIAEATGEPLKPSVLVA